MWCRSATCKAPGEPSPESRAYYPAGRSRCRAGGGARTSARDTHGLSSKAEFTTASILELEPVQTPRAADGAVTVVDPSGRRLPGGAASTAGDSGGGTARRSSQRDAWPRRENRFRAPPGTACSRNSIIGVLSAGQTGHTCIISTEDPSKNDPENIIPLCPNCHLGDQHDASNTIARAKLLLYVTKSLTWKRFDSKEVAATHVQTVAFDVKCNQTIALF
jgi:hypothetical protein